MSVCRAVYALTRTFPADERFGLTDPIRRAAVSVATNIAEGQGRGTTKGFLNFLSIANGSRQEVETQLMLAIDLGFIGIEQARETLEFVAETGRVLTGLRSALR